MSHNLWQLHFDKAQLAFHVSQFWLYGNEYYLSQMICLWTEFLQSKTFFHFASLPTLNKIRHWNSWRKIYFRFGSKFPKILLIIVIKSLLLKSSTRVRIRCLQNGIRRRDHAYVVLAENICLCQYISRNQAVIKLLYMFLRSKLMERMNIYHVA